MDSNSSKFKKGHISWNTGLTRHSDSRMKSGSKYGHIKPPYIKNCPDCSELLEYSTVYVLVESIEKNRKCNLCANAGKGWQTANYPYKRTPEVNKKSRLSAINRITTAKGQIMPNYNKDSISIIESYGSKHGYHFQHAENGGEVRVLGYFLDAYDRDNNVVLEIDEEYHFKKDGLLSDRDITRQQEIEKHLNCKFIRLKI